jgi:hypothetical protein
MSQIGYGQVVEVEYAANVLNEPSIFKIGGDATIAGELHVWGGMNFSGLAIFQGTTDPSSPNLITKESILDAYESIFDIWAVNGIVAGDLALAEVADWADYVFEPGYELRPIDEVEKFINMNGHLPGIPSESSLKESSYYMVHDMNKRFMVKIEELTLYTIKQEHMINDLVEKLNGYEALKSELEEIKTLLDKMVLTEQIERN